MGKVHGSLARAGKVKSQTPKVDKDEKLRRALTGRAKKRQLYKRRYINVVSARDKRRRPNSQQT